LGVKECQVWFRQRRDKEAEGVRPAPAVPKGQVGGVQPDLDTCLRPGRRIPWDQINNSGKMVEMGMGQKKVVEIINSKIF